MTDGGFPDHRPVGLRLVFHSAPQNAFVLKGSPQWEFPPKPTSESDWEVRDQIADQVLASHLNGLCQAAEAQHCEVLWERACCAVQDMLNRFACSPVQSSKGSLPSFSFQSTIRSPKRNSLRSSRIAKCQSLIRELHVKFSLMGPHLDDHQKLLFDKTVANFRRIANLLELDLSTFSFACTDDIFHTQQDFARQIRDQDWKSQNAAIRGWKHKLLTGAAKLMKQGKSLTGSIPTMLTVVADKMGAVYNKYQGIDPSEMLDSFLLKYRVGIQDTFRECKLPSLTPRDFFDACQKKPACKASGLDQWRYKDLQQLPPKGWVPFHLWRLWQKPLDSGRRSSDACL